MTTKTKTEKAIDFIAGKGAARTAEIAEASGIPEKGVCTMLYYYVRGGVLVSCRVSQPGKASCNEYRLATGVTAQTWREFKVGLFSEAAVPKAPPKRITPPAPTPADRPEVSETNTGSTSAENSSLAATGRAVTDKKPHRKASQPAPGAGGHVTSDRGVAGIAYHRPKHAEQPKFGYFSDGSIEIIDHGIVTVLDAADAKRLADFLMNCMISAEVNA